jgi:lysophospholipase L1-like esterase
MRDFLHPSASGYRLGAEAMEPDLASNSHFDGRSADLQSA